MATVEEVFLAMVQHFGTDLAMIVHMFTVHGFAMALAAAEKVQADQLLGLEIASLVHSIGAKECWSKYHIYTKKALESEGTELARALVQKLGFAEDLVDRVCFLTAHHMTYTDIKDLDHLILVESYFLATAKNKKWTNEQVQAFCERVFKTKLGIKLLKTLYNL